MKAGYLRATLYRLIGLSGLLAFATPAFALGTAPGTVITNTAVVNYRVSGTDYTANASSSLTVYELLDVSAAWQDAANVQAVSPSSSIVMSFRLTNTGNGSEQFSLSADGSVNGDNFDFNAANIQIWIDDGDDVWESSKDTLYNGSNGPVLNGGSAKSDSTTIFVVADVPAGQRDGALGKIRLSATSVTAGSAGQTGNVGALIKGGGDGGVDAVVGVSGGTASAVGTVEVISSGVSINKTVRVVDPNGGSNPVTGATLHYTLQVNVAGSNAINNLIITDPVPADTTYVPGSLKLNNVTQSDAPADYADFNITNTNTVTVDLSHGGTLSIAPPAKFTIEFSTIIN